MHPEAEAIARDARSRALEAYSLEAVMASARVPAVSVARIEGGELKWAEAWGVTHEGGESATAATCFQAGSISKSIAALCALRLVAAGRISLDDPIPPQRDGWAIVDGTGREAQVTLRQLLSHTAGYNVHGFDGYEHDKPVPSPVDVINGRGNTPALRSEKPQGHYDYAGGGYVVMQQVLTELLGQPFPAIAQEWAIEPLGLTSSTYQQPPLAEIASKAAWGHRNGQSVRGGWHVYPEMAAGGLWTTATDLARFLIAMREAVRGDGRNPILPMSLAREAITQQAPDYPVGLGLMLDAAVRPGGKPEGARFGHLGDTEGFLASIEIMTDSGDGIVVMTNSNDAAPVLVAVQGAIARL